MRISQRLQDFLTGFCGPDEDLDETARVLRSAQRSELARWLRPELDAAIRDQAISPEDAAYLMSRTFASSAEVAAWVAERRREWFG